MLMSEKNVYIDWAYVVSQFKYSYKCSSLCKDAILCFAIYHVCTLLH